MRPLTKVTDLSPEQLAEWKPLIDEQLAKGIKTAELEIARLKSENATLRNEIAALRDELSKRQPPA